jgi:FkbM family methyltransferase
MALKLSVGFREGPGTQWTAGGGCFMISPMSATPGTFLFRKLSNKGFLPAHAAEIGVYRPESSSLIDYINSGVRCTLVEADPSTAALIRERFGKLANVTLHEVALCDHNGTVDLVRREASTFIRTLPGSPAMVNDRYEVKGADVFKVEAKTFDRIDDGSIDLLSIDIEGGEWFVLKHMKSRPAVLSIETHGAAYLNPYLREILGWTGENGYRVLCKTWTDTVFVGDRVPVTVGDRMGLALMNLRLALRRARKRVARRSPGSSRNRIPGNRETEP